MQVCDFLQACESIEGFHLGSAREIALCCSLGKGYQLAGRPHQARAVLERALSVCESNGGRNSIQAASLAATLGTTYRWAYKYVKIKLLSQEKGLSCH